MPPKVQPVQNPGSSERGTGESGAILGTYPHATEHAPGPANQVPQDTGRKPLLTEGEPDHVIDTHGGLTQQVGAR